MKERNEIVKQNPEKWSGLDQYPKAKVKYWNSEKGFGSVIVQGQEYDLDTRNVYPSLGSRNPKFDPNIELHFVSEDDSSRRRNNPLANVVWGNPESTEIVTVAEFKYKNGDINISPAYINGDGSISIASKIKLPPGTKVEDLELGAGYEVGKFSGTRDYSYIYLLGSKKYTVEEIKVKREDSKYDSIISGFKSWYRRIKVWSETGSDTESGNKLPENADLRYLNGWYVTLDGDERSASIDRINGKFCVDPVTENYVGTDYGRGVDDFGDVGQAVGSGGFREGMSEKANFIRILKPDLKFDLPTEIAKVPEENCFNNAQLDKILTVRDCNDSKTGAPFTYVALDTDGNKFAFWSEKYRCWRKFGDSDVVYLDNVKSYNDTHYTSTVQHDDPGISTFFEMIRMAKNQEMDLTVIAPWISRI